MSPGATLTSRNHTCPASSTIRSERERSRSPSASWAEHRDPGALGGGLVGELGGHDELRGAGGVARGVVVDPAVGLDPDRGQRHRAGAGVDTGTATSSPSTNRSTSAVVAVGEGVDHRAGQVVAAPDHACSPAPTRSWPASRSGAGPGARPARPSRRGAELAERLVGQRHRGRGAHARPARPRPWRPACRRRRGRRPGGHRRRAPRAARGPRASRRPRRSRRAAAGARSAAAPRAASRSRSASTSRSSTSSPRRAAPRRPGARSAATRRARGRARRRGRRTASRRSRSRSAPLLLELGSGQVGVRGLVAAGHPWRRVATPNVSRSSISASSTPASRRTPSRIRSGVG